MVIILLDINFQKEREKKRERKREKKRKKEKREKILNERRS